MFLFSFAFFLFVCLCYFCWVRAVVIMGSQPQMSLALPCRALWEGRWGAEVTAAAQLAQRGVRGQAPRGQAEGDNYPQHCSVDLGKIFILLPSRTRKATAVSHFKQDFCVSLQLKEYELWNVSQDDPVPGFIQSRYNHKHHHSCSNFLMVKKPQSKRRFCLLLNSLRDFGKLWMLCPLMRWVWPVDVDGWLEVLSHVCTLNMFPFLWGTGAASVSTLPALHPGRQHCPWGDQKPTWAPSGPPHRPPHYTLHDFFPRVVNPEFPITPGRALVGGYHARFPLLVPCFSQQYDTWLQKWPAAMVDSQLPGHRSGRLT